MNTTLSSIEIVKSIISPTSLFSLLTAHYQHVQPRHITLLSIGDNDNYLVQTKEENYVLRIYRYNKHWLPSKSHHLFEIDLLRFLKNTEISVSYPIRKNDGDYIDILHAPEGPRYWGLFSYAPGQQMRFTDDNCYRYGQIISRMHMMMNNFNTSHSSLKIDHQFLLTIPFSRIANYLGPDEKRLNYLQRITEKLVLAIEQFNQKAPKNEWGVIGGDFHGGNHFCDKNGNMTLFDFDLCGYGWRTYDIAVFKWALFNVCRRAPQVKSRHLLWLAFLNGYQSNIPLTSEQLNMLPLFVQARQIWLMGSETTYPDKILDKTYWNKMFDGLKAAANGLYD